MTTSTLINAVPQTLTANPRIRQATFADIPVLAQIEYEAILPPMNVCFWDELLAGTQTDALQFITAMLRADASNWGTFADFWVMELNEQIVGGAVGYAPYSDDYRPLNLEQLGTVANSLSWSAETAIAFRKRYEEFWSPEPRLEFLKPPAPWMIETVAVLPEARGRGLSKILLNTLIEAGRSRQHSHVGLLVINGNNRARSVYESLGFKPYQAFYADYFSDRFPGVTKLRMALS